MRNAYAISEDGKTALMFPNKALRDLFIAELPPKSENSFGKDFKVGTCDQYRKAEMAEQRWMNDEGIWADREYVAIDMSIAEFWDGIWDLYDKAYDAGLL